MSIQQPAPVTQLTVLVPGGSDGDVILGGDLLHGDQGVGEASPGVLQGDDAPLHTEGFLGGLVRRKVDALQLPLDRAKAEMARVEQEIGGLFSGIQLQTVGGYQLKEVQVSVGINAQGSIAVVSAGVSASLTLVYDRPGA